VKPIRMFFFLRCDQIVIIWTFSIRRERTPHTVVEDTNVAWKLVRTMLIGMFLKFLEASPKPTEGKLSSRNALRMGWCPLSSKAPLFAHLSPANQRK
jgi:hypothetical protein